MCFHQKNMLHRVPSKYNDPISLLRLTSHSPSRCCLGSNTPPSLDTCRKPTCSFIHEVIQVSGRMDLVVGGWMDGGGSWMVRILYGWMHEKKNICVCWMVREMYGWIVRWLDEGLVGCVVGWAIVNRIPHSYPTITLKSIYVYECHTYIKHQMKSESMSVTH